MDLVLLIVTVFDLKNGTVATAIHGIAAVYVGVSIAFGHRMIQWADGHFNYWFGNGKKPVKIKYGKEHARKEREAWYRHLLSLLIGGGILISIIFYINNSPQTEALMHIMLLWSLIVVIDFVISFSYTLFPKKQKT
ncbi:2TM domain-containing protein [Oceanobacillus sp. CFH 90083]|uniref:2TM domain-containing protein n=1 Tax=Oceanobacillus sp. CFH 90083 TaxID=2592336 RepID=UPI00128DA6A7|nr:2TM domain-containing protein [Oceanobacillus sp. CFH 90083]